MPLSNRSLQSALRMILKSEHHRMITVDQIAHSFIEFTVQFFKDLVSAKLSGIQIDMSWYRSYFLTRNFSAIDTVIYSGLNKKTIENIYGTFKKSVAYEVALDYHDELINKVEALVDHDFSDLEIELTIKYGGVSVDLSLSETLIVVTALGAKRAQIRGGAWSELGKRIELPLMLTLAKLYSVPEPYYSTKGRTGESREVDFHFIDGSGISHYCEVKIMGKGNPEGADSVFPRDSNIFVADTLSDANKEQLTRRGRAWVELSEPDGYRKMFRILKYLDIPCQDFHGDLDTALDEIIPQVFQEIA